MFSALTIFVILSVNVLLAYINPPKVTFSAKTDEISIILPYFCSLIFINALVTTLIQPLILTSIILSISDMLFSSNLCINELKLYPDKLITISISLDSKKHHKDTDNFLVTVGE
jgi:cadmium resistance protein CadD (predicted permease)